MFTLNIQIGGNHYKKLNPQPIELITQYNLNYCLGNIIKYVSRYKYKHGALDLKKASHYIDLELTLKKSNSKNLKSAQSYCTKNNLNNHQSEIILNIIKYHLTQNPKYLITCKEKLKELINTYK